MQKESFMDALTTPEVFVEGIGRIDILGSNARLLLYSRQGAALERVPVVGIICPLSAIPPAIQQVCLALMNTEFGSIAQIMAASLIH